MENGQLQAIAIGLANLQACPPCLPALVGAAHDHLQRVGGEPQVEEEQDDMMTDRTSISLVSQYYITMPSRS